MRDLRERLFGQVQPNVLPDQVAVAEIYSFDELRFPPAIEPVSRAGFPLQAWNKFFALLFRGNPWSPCRWCKPRRED